MIEIGVKAKESRGFGSTIKGIVQGLKYNKIFLITSGTILDLGTANSGAYFGIIPFIRWRVIGMGMHWVEASTANEDPVVEFGRTGDGDAYGTMTSAITGGEKFNLYDHQNYGLSGILTPEVIAESSATMVVTWTEGSEFNVWQDNIKILKVLEAAVAGMTSGMIFCYFIIEVDTGEKW